jgi:hypothetical protein
MGPITFPIITFPNITFPIITFPNITFPNITFPNITFPNITFPNITFPNITFLARARLWPVGTTPLQQVHSIPITGLRLTYGWRHGPRPTAP